MYYILHPAKHTRYGEETDQSSINQVNNERDNIMAMRNTSMDRGGKKIDEHEFTMCIHHNNRIKEDRFPTRTAKSCTYTIATTQHRRYEHKPSHI